MKLYENHQEIGIYNDSYLILSFWKLFFRITFQKISSVAPPKINPSLMKPHLDETKVGSLSHTLCKSLNDTYLILIFWILFLTWSHVKLTPSNRYRLGTDKWPSVVDIKAKVIFEIKSWNSMIVFFILC